MKIKLTWGTGIVIAMALFMVFILQFVYRASVYDKYKHHLDAEDYYEDELKYQQEIDKEINANNLKENIKLIKTAKGLEIIFPDQFEPSEIKGTIKLMRRSDFKLDIKKDIELSSNTFLILDKELVPGKYEISIDWLYNSKGYMYKTSYFY